MAETKTKNKYIEAVGRRKTSVARVRITPSSKPTYIINDKPLAEYFGTDELIKISEEAFKKVELDKKFDVSVKVLGGGIKSQSESIRLGISRALIKYDPELRKSLKKLGFLKRDPRIKERKKFGLKKSRKAAQWSKR